MPVPTTEFIYTSPNRAKRAWEALKARGLVATFDVNEPRDLWVIVDEHDTAAAVEILTPLDLMGDPRKGKMATDADRKGQ